MQLCLYETVAPIPVPGDDCQRLSRRVLLEALEGDREKLGAGGIGMLAVGRHLDGDLARQIRIAAARTYQLSGIVSLPGHIGGPRKRGCSEL